MTRISIEDVKQYLEDNNWQLVSDTYKNLDTELEVICSEGHHVFQPYKKLRNKLECPICETNELKKEQFNIKSKDNNVRRVLALDQATKQTGWAIYDNQQLIAYGIFNANNSLEVARIHSVKEWVISMIHNWQPDLIGLEGIQYQNNKNIGVTTFETLARLQGVLMECCYSEQVQFLICPTATWRHHCGVKGASRADRKQSMKQLVKEWFDMTTNDDISDAIGIGRYASSQQPQIYQQHVKQIKEENFKIESWE